MRWRYNLILDFISCQINLKDKNSGRFFQTWASGTESSPSTSLFNIYIDTGLEPTLFLFLEVKKEQTDKRIWMWIYFNVIFFFLNLR